MWVYNVYDMHVKLMYIRTLYMYNVYKAIYYGIYGTWVYIIRMFKYIIWVYIV